MIVVQEIKNTQLLQSILNVESKVNNGVPEKVAAVEQYLYRPFSVGENGARAEVNTKLSLSGTTKGNGAGGKRFFFKFGFMVVQIFQQRFSQITSSYPHNNITSKSSIGQLNTGRVNNLLLFNDTRIMLVFILSNATQIFRHFVCVLPHINY